MTEFIEVRVFRDLDPEINRDDVVVNTIKSRTFIGRTGHSKIRLSKMTPMTFRKNLYISHRYPDQISGINDAFLKKRRTP